MMVYSYPLSGSYRVEIFELRNFLKVGRCLHVIALVSFMVFVAVFFHAMHVYESGRQFSGILLFMFSWSTSAVPLLAELDAYSRYQNYKMIRDLLRRFGFRKMIISKFRHSKCQREAALFAACEMGFRLEIRVYFQECGYRWYHVFPDFLFNQPQILMSRDFWLATFFTKSYVPKYNFSKS